MYEIKTAGQSGTTGFSGAFRLTNIIANSRLQLTALTYEMR
jgi:hypothetical protein